MEKNRKSKVKKWLANTENSLALILIIIGICILAWVSIKWYQERQISSNYSEVQGTIVGYDETRKNGYERKTTGRTTFWPIVEYVVDGDTYQIVSEYGSRYKRENDHISVKYNPDNPEDAVLEGEEGPNLFFVVGFLFTSIGIAILLGRAKSGRIQMSGLLLGSFSFSVPLCYGLYIVKGTEDSWNPIAIIAYNPVAILIYFLLIVAVYLMISSLWAIVSWQ